jgi:hypothetical protein
MDENFVTEDLSKENAHSTSEVGDWIAREIEK